MGVFTERERRGMLKIVEKGMYPIGEEDELEEGRAGDWNGGRTVTLRATLAV